MDDEKFDIFYRESIASDPELLVSGVDYDEAQDLCLFLAATVDCFTERNYQGIPIQIGVYFEESRS